MRASVVITTKNRKEDLRAAIRSALAQTEPAEVIVMDDASTDGTVVMVPKEFPQVRLARSQESLGLIVQRNRAATLATGGVIFSIDDDAVFASIHTVAQTLQEFDHPRAGAVAVPYIEPHKSDAIQQHAPAKNGFFVTDTFIGTAHAVRRDVFLKLGGYRGHLVHQGEERDYCIRMLEAGYVVRLGNADPIHHLESPKRDFRRMDFYGRRNDILFAWHNVPWPYFPFHLLGTTLNGLQSAIRAGRCAKMLQGIASGYADCFRRWNERQPVTAKIYGLHRLLKKRGPQALFVIEQRLPKIQTP